MVRLWKVPHYKLIPFRSKLSSNFKKNTIINNINQYSNEVTVFVPKLGG